MNSPMLKVLSAAAALAAAPRRLHRAGCTANCESPARKAAQKRAAASRRRNRR